MRGEVSTIRPDVPMPRGDAEWFAQMIGEPRPAMRRANRQSSIRNHQSQAVYEYDVYGQPAAADPGHPNPFAFTGRRFDPDTGLYYYRARYYNPTIGRFLQTDPIGYGDGMNWYAYCGNNSVCRSDPMGLEYQFLEGADQLTLVWAENDSTVAGLEIIGTWTDIDAFISDAYRGLIEEFDADWEKEQAGWQLAGNNQGYRRQRWWFWRLKALEFLSPSMGAMYRTMEDAGFAVTFTIGGISRFAPDNTNGHRLVWNWTSTTVSSAGNSTRRWDHTHPLATLAHELQHAYEFCIGMLWPMSSSMPQQERDDLTKALERSAVHTENMIRLALFRCDPTERDIWPRPGYHFTVRDVANATTAEEAWRLFDGSFQWD